MSHYNTLGQLDWDEDECGKRTDYAYDYQGRQTVTTYPQVAGETGNRTTENVYSCCHLKWTSDEEGNRTYYSYDGIGRVEKTWTDIQGDENVYDPLVSYTYDGPFGAKDTVTTRVSEGGTIVPRTTVYNNDDMGRMSKIDYPYNSQPGDLLGSEEFLYDGLGRLAAKKNGENKVTAYEYDHLNRVSKVSYDYGSFALPIAISNPDVSYIYKGNTSLVEHVDTRRDILGESGGDATRRASYTYYKDGRMKSYSPAVPVGYGSLEYTWNSIGQKTSMKVPAGVGNVARMLEYRYDNSGRQVGLDVKVSTCVSSTGTTAPVPGDTTRFFYDASQNRTKLINKAGDVYQYVYDPTASFPAAVYEQGPQGRYVNVREPDGALVSREKYNNTGQRVANSIYHFDGLGSTRAISDGSGTITDTYSYDAWGNTTHTSGTTADNPYQYVGRYGYYTHYQEPNFDLLQLGVRYYDASVGRFISRDPVFSVRGSRYLYVEDDPITLMDPDGLIARSDKSTPFPGCGKPMSKGSKRTKEDDIRDAISKICNALKAGKCKSCTYNKKIACHLKFCENPHVQCKAQTSDECKPDSCSSVPGDPIPGGCKSGRQKPNDTITFCPNNWDEKGCDKWPDTPGNATIGNLLHEMNHLCGDCSEANNDKRVGDCLKEVIGVK